MGETKMLKKLDVIESRGEFLSLFVVVRKAAGRNSKHHRLNLWCVIYCDNGIFTLLLIESGKVLYKISNN